MNKYLRLLRIHQWYKNGIALIPLVFSGELLNISKVFLSLSGFLIFCLLSSSIYILNDIKDREEDKKHPSKKHRPIASGEVSIKEGLIISFILLLTSLTIAYLSSPKILVIIVLFIISNLLYTYWAKHKFLLDNMFIGFNFILRAVGGAIVISVAVSGWLLVFVYLFANYLAFAKRRSESTKADFSHRKNLTTYVKIVDFYLVSSATLLIVVYIIYVFATQRTGLIPSIPFLIYGIYRHLNLVYTKDIGEDASKVLTEKGLVVSMIVFGMTVLFALYLQQYVIDLLENTLMIKITGVVV